MQKVLFVRSGSRYRVAKSVEVHEAASFYAARSYERERPFLGDPTQVAPFLIGQLQHCEEEFFCVLFLDTQHRLIAFEKMFRGTIDGSAVHPREVVREVLDRNAAAVILAHNHPSGSLNPSDADLNMTQHMKKVLGMIDVRVLDHFIVGGDLCRSIGIW